MFVGYHRAQLWCSFRAPLSTKKYYATREKSIFCNYKDQSGRLAYAILRLMYQCVKLFYMSCQSEWFFQRFRKMEVKKSISSWNWRGKISLVKESNIHCLLLCCLSWLWNVFRFLSPPTRLAWSTSGISGSRETASYTKWRLIIGPRRAPSPHSPYGTKSEKVRTTDVAQY